MRWLLTLLIVSSSSACGKSESPTVAAGSATAKPSEPAADPAPAPKPEPAPAATDDGSTEIAERVVKDVGSKALGSQTIEASCVAVSVIPSGTWTIASARLKDCGDKTARTIVWLYKRQGSGKWNEDYVGQPPKCWKGVPPDIARAVAIATKIPSC